MGLFRKSKDDREELKGKIDELMEEYDNEEIDGATYGQKMMDLISSFRDEDDED